MMKTDVTVIGGGPAGLLASAVAAQNNKKVVLLDKNDILGRKLRITGKGRCNITNSADISDFIGMVCTNSSFLYSAFYSFTNDDLISLFKSLGVDVKEERGGRIFPKSDSAKEVADALAKYAKDNGVIVKKDTVKSVKKNAEGCFEISAGHNGKIESDKLIIATGGVSYPLTGSTGDGYKFAESFGHTVISPKPSLIPLTVSEGYISDLQGLSLKNISINIEKDSKSVYKDFGEMLFTHYGLSGPVILSASSNLKDIEKNNYTVHIDLKPALDINQLDKRVQRDFEKNTNKNFSNSLDELLPKKLIPVIIKLSGIDPYTKVNQISRAQRIKLCSLIKDLSFAVNGTRPVSEAIITRGGVCVKEVNPSTMQSKLVDGLYFAGEVLDVDAYTGGYNLQIAFSTGYLAGMNV